MDLETIAPILEDIIKETLSEKVYPFGFAGTTGTSNKVASGKLRDSVKVNVVKSGDITEIQILMEYYWQWVQSGRSRGKGYVPVGSLMKWIKDRGITPNKGDIKGMAYAISKNINKFGIRPANFLDLSLEKIMNDQRIIDALGEATYDDLINAITGI
jgi:hypothetical protein